MRFGYLNENKIKNKLLKIIEHENINIDDNALKALISKNKDFRQILNILQCMHSLHGKDLIKLDDILTYIGIPSDAVISNIISIISDNSFATSCEKIYSLFLNNEWNLSSLISYLAKHIMANLDNYNDNQIIYIMNKLSDIEVKISCSNDQEIQLYALIATFHYIKKIK